LSGRAETVVMLDQILEKYGEDPEVWLPIFWEKTKKI
jgi:type IV secretion system protein VirB4